MEQDIKSLVTWLVEKLDQSGLTELELEQHGYRIRLSKDKTAGLCAQLPAHDAASTSAASALSYRTVGTQTTPPAGPPPAKNTPPGSTVIEASLHGTLHLQAAPNQAPYVAQGSVVRKGQTLASIEAMKMFHEVVCDCDGVVLAVLAENSQDVVAGQPLFQIG